MHKGMKYKIIRIVCIVMMLLLACVQSAIVLWNYGRTGLGSYDPYYDLGEFSWGTIVGTDWLGWALCSLWFSLLVIPWIQSFVAMGKQRCFRSTLSGKSGFFHVLFTVFNVSLIVGCLFLLFKGGDEDDMRFGYDRLMEILVVAGLVYIPWALLVIMRNLRQIKVSHKSESQNPPIRDNKVWHWIVSCLCFTMLGLYAFDGWYNWRYDFYEGRASQWVDGKYGYINRLHQVVIPHIFDNCGDFADGVAYVGIDSEDGTRYGCIDRYGNIIIPCIYDWCSAPIYDVIYVKLNGMEACFTKDGKECIPMIYDHIDLFYPDNNGLALVISTDERYGFIRRNGDVVIPISYDYCEAFFTDGLVRAQIGEKWGYLNHKGDEVIPFIYDEAGIFKDKRAEVKMGNETYFIDTEGRKI